MKLATRSTQSSAPQRRELLEPLILVTLFALLLLDIVVSVSFGAISIPVNVIAQILLNGTHLFHFVRRWDASTELIIWQVRMPGVVGAVLVGAALSVAGVLFQGMLRNPLADPFLIGTSSGAALGATIAFLFPFETFYGPLFSLTPVFAFGGAMASVLFVYSIARTASGTPIVTLLLAGVVMNAVLVAVQTLIVSLSPHPPFEIQALFNWLFGGIAVEDWSPILVVGMIVLVGTGIAWSMAGTLDVFVLGEEHAAHLGLSVERSKFMIVMLASLLTAAAVSISGLIGFVGLVIPHMTRLMLGPRHRLLLPASALGGAIFLVLADLLARVLIAPSVLPVGVFTALTGAPFFLFLLRNKRSEYRW